VRSNTQSDTECTVEQPFVCVKSCSVLEAAIQNFDSMSESGRFRLFTAVRAGGKFCCYGECIERFGLVVKMHCNGNFTAEFN
jgi:hypothetical protein